MFDKNAARLRRAKQTRAKIRELGAVRLTVTRTNSHIYAQVTAADGSKVFAAASTAEKKVRAKLKPVFYTHLPQPAPRRHDCMRCTRTRSCPN